jgi:hypothetical protein
MARSTTASNAAGTLRLTALGGLTFAETIACITE